MHISRCLSLRTYAATFMILVLIPRIGATQPTTPVHATVIKNVNLRNDSSDDLPPIRLLKPPAKLDLLQTEPEDGYFKVLTAENQQGWIWGRNIRIEETALVSPLAAAASEFSSDWDKPAPNKSSFTGPSGHCGFAGIGDEADSNQRKNRTDIPSSYHDVAFQALASLDYPVAPKHRSEWSAEQLAVIEPFEGIAVRVVGFLVAVKPQTGSKEATNCRFTKSVETDWHMALVEQAGLGEKDAVVIETTPRIRRSHPKWTPAALKPWTDTDQPVRISGWTFLDSEHRNHLNKYRSTLWEIHPITKIEVFKAGKWVNLDQ